MESSCIPHVSLVSGWHCYMPFTLHKGAHNTSAHSVAHGAKAILLN